MVKRGNKILVSEGYEKIKKETFYKSIGGGIEFLENNKEAFKEKYHIVDDNFETDVVLVDTDKFKIKN